MSAEYEQPAVVEGEIVDLDALLEEKPLQYPPAVRKARHITTHRRTCAFGKGSPESHGAIGDCRPFSSGEILEIAARVEAGRRPATPWRLVAARPRPARRPRWARRAAVVMMSSRWSAANPGSTIDPGMLSSALALPQALGGYVTPNSCGNAAEP